MGATAQSFDVIFFDAGSVLFTTHQKHQSRIQTVLTARGYPLDVHYPALERAEQVLRTEGGHKHWFHTWEQEQALWDRYYRAICDALPDATSSLADELFHLCHFVSHCTIYDDVYATLTQLRETYRLAVISNAYPSLDWVFDRLDLRQYFVHITLSAFAGCAKPDERIYRTAMEAVQCQPHQAFFIDNKLQNVQAAQALGMEGIVLMRTASPSPEYLTTLKALPDHLASYSQKVRH